MSQEDHREKNILLAKNLNLVKMDLRSKKKDLQTLKSELRMEKQRNSKLESEQMTIKNRIDFLKQQLDETFLKNTFGYIQLSQQLELMHQESVQSVNDSGITGESDVLNSMAAFDAQQLTFLAKIKMMSESLAANTSIGVFEPRSRSFNDSNSQSTSRRHSLSFDSFQLGLNSTFVKDSQDDSDLNRTFLAEEPVNTTFEEVLPMDGSRNVTVRNNKKHSKIKSRMSLIQLPSQKENQPMATRSNYSPASKTFILRRGCRSKKVDYNETSLQRKK